ncbi:serine hydrolase [Nitratireductor sp.]|uniref:serine hydrolase n=1 Tax=Nitratireductor sp. TaxID=1872084 RepID=UPI00345BF9A0|nr:serine hydrolase [Nitratireductor sp.]MCV0380333.1 serine hydrolase [Nitratireductor sp.]
MRDGEYALFGFGEVGIVSGREPDGDTQIRVGSISKTFTGLALALTVATGSTALTDPV